MKIKMLGPNRARVTKGWFVKRFAEVVRQVSGCYWYFEGTEIGVRSRVPGLDRRLDEVAQAFNDELLGDKLWKRVERLPEARLLKGPTT